MSGALPSSVALLSLLLAASSGFSAPREGSRPEGICGLIRDEASLPSYEIEAALASRSTEAEARRQAAGDASSLTAAQAQRCEIALRCLLEARRPSRLGAPPAGETAGGVGQAMWKLCARLSEVLAATPAEIHQLSVEAAQDEPCHGLLHCLLDARPEADAPDLGARGGADSGEPVSAAPAEGWKEEFERICGQTEAATSLTREELDHLLAQSDELLETLERLKLPEAKVYVFRLKRCRSFFQYALELREMD